MPASEAVNGGGRDSRSCLATGLGTSCDPGDPASPRSHTQDLEIHRPESRSIPARHHGLGRKGIPRSRYPERNHPEMDLGFCSVETGGTEIGPQRSPEANQTIIRPQTETLRPRTITSRKREGHSSRPIPSISETPEATKTKDGSDESRGGQADTADQEETERAGFCRLGSLGMGRILLIQPTILIVMLLLLLFVFSFLWERKNEMSSLVEKRNCTDTKAVLQLLITKKKK